MLQIGPIESPEALRAALELVAEYRAWDLARTAELGFPAEELAAFHYDDPVDALPAGFAPPAGRFLLATWSGEAAGCGALRRISPEHLEMKRVYVRPAFRGKGVGRSLVRQLLREAGKMGCQAVRLETTTFMREALALYREFGFRPVAPYYEIPPVFAPVTVFLERPVAGDA